MLTPTRLILKLHYTLPSFAYLRPRGPLKEEAVYTKFYVNTISGFGKTIVKLDNKRGVGGRIMNAK